MHHLTLVERFFAALGDLLERPGQGRLDVRRASGPVAAVDGKGLSKAGLRADFGPGQRQVARQFAAEARAPSRSARSMAPVRSEAQGSRPRVR